ncbi:MAG: hypothetical protein AAF601_09810 [Pseudomonadota bacterium]
MTKLDPKPADTNVLQSLALVFETQMRITEARERLAKAHISTAQHRENLEKMSERLAAIYEDMRA